VIRPKTLEERVGIVETKLDMLIALNAGVLIAVIAGLFHP
jgi:hypothetical protein